MHRVAEPVDAGLRPALRQQVNRKMQTPLVRQALASCDSLAALPREARSTGCAAIS